MSRITCCYNCTERYIGCHGKCQRYIEQSTANTKKREEEFVERNVKYALAGLHDNRMNTDRPGRHRVNYK